MNRWLCVGFVAVALALAPVTADARAGEQTTSHNDFPAKQRRHAPRRDVGGTVVNAFRTAGNAVAYGVHSTGRVLTGGRHRSREADRAEHYQRRMERSAGATRDSARTR